MEKIRSKKKLILTVIVFTGLVGGAVAAALRVKSQETLPVHKRRDVTFTLAMSYKITSDRENRQWEAYRREISIKKSGDYVERCTWADGKVEYTYTENGRMIKARMDNDEPATSRPFKVMDYSLDENYLARQPELQKENPVVYVNGIKTYVLTYSHGNSYSEVYIAPEIGQPIKTYRREQSAMGTLESIQEPVQIQFDTLDDSLWKSISRNKPVVPVYAPDTSHGQGVQ
ncbi:MAG: hypothetical protein RMM98_02990 [Acidobacteriota bacterium]|nr:hypothetical protein [Acidobacteriota bacterium]